MVNVAEMILSRIKLLAIAMCCTLIGCAQPQDQVELDATDSLAGIVPFELPATFTGHIPCPDCLKVDITLNLRPDFIYQLRKTYQTEQGPRNVESQMRKWRYSPEGRLIVLGKQKGMLKTYAVLDDDRLQFLELESEANDSKTEYQLIRSLELDPFKDSVKMRGSFRLADGAPVLTECSSGKDFAVGTQGDYQAMMQNYMNMPHNFGEPLLASFTGKLSSFPLSESQSQEFIEIEEFKRFYTNQDCEGDQLRANLTGTFWKLIEIDGQEIAIGESQAPYIVLEPNKQLRGHGGCNRITGTYLAKGELFLVKRDESTRIACPEGIEVENRLLQALDQSEAYLIESDVLQLRDQDDEIRAKLKSGP